MATRSNTKGDIDRDLPRKRKNDAADSGQNKKKRKKSQKRFVWKPHLQTLKDKLEDKKYDDPSVENCVEIANEMLPNAPGITGEIVRTKTRTKEIKKFLKSLKRKLNKEKKGDDDDDDSDDDSGSGDSDSQYDSDGSDDGSEDSFSGLHNLNEFCRVPSFWTVENSEHRAYFTSRRLLMTAKHASGTSSFDVQYTIEPPTVTELMQLLSSNCPASLKWLDCSNIRIQNQIKAWKPITWKVRLDAPPPLMPGLYHAEAKGQFSWIEMPFHAPVRYTNFGDAQVDIENVEASRKEFQSFRRDCLDLQAGSSQPKPNDPVDPRVNSKNSC